MLEMREWYGGGLLSYWVPCVVVLTVQGHLLIFKAEVVKKALPKEKKDAVTSESPAWCLNEIISQAGGGLAEAGDGEGGGGGVVEAKGKPVGKGGKKATPKDVLDEKVPKLPDPINVDDSVVVANSLVEFAPQQSACGAAFELTERQPTRGALGWIQSAQTRTLTLRGSTQVSCVCEEFLGMWKSP